MFTVVTLTTSSGSTGPLGSVPSGMAVGPRKISFAREFSSSNAVAPTSPVEGSHNTWLYRCIHLERVALFGIYYCLTSLNYIYTSYTPVLLLFVLISFRFPFFFCSFLLHYKSSFYDFFVWFFLCMLALKSNTSILISCLQTQPVPCQGRLRALHAPSSWGSPSRSLPHSLGPGSISRLRLSCSKQVP